MHWKTIFTSVLCEALMTSISISVQNSNWAAPDDSVAMKLIAMDRMWAEANCRPHPGLEDVFADEFLGTAPDGTRYGKEEAMAPLKYHGL